jgi:hypothetical protein
MPRLRITAHDHKRGWTAIPTKSAHEPRFRENIMALKPRLWLLGEWHEVRPPACSLAWDRANVGSVRASPVCLGVNIPLRQEVRRWSRR